MAVVPKKKTSVSRKGLRRAGQHHKLYKKDTISCSNCGATMLPHKVCSSCGTYKGKEYIKMKAAKEETAETSNE